MPESGAKIACFSISVAVIVNKSVRQFYTDGGNQLVKDKESVDGWTLCKARDTVLEGMVCTNRCEHRAKCGVKRIPFLVHVQVNEILRTDNETGKFAGKLEKIRGVPCISFPLLGRRMDEYITSAAGGCHVMSKQKEEDSARS